jgi:hypothetical protein
MCLKKKSVRFSSSSQRWFGCSVKVTWSNFKLLQCVNQWVSQWVSQWVNQWVSGLVVLAWRWQSFPLRDIAVHERPVVTYRLEC